MPHDWQIGDLALCIDDSPPRMIDGLLEARREYVEALRCGRVYTVTHIACGITLPDCVGIGDIHQRAGGCADRFIKVTPPEADEFDHEVISLLAAIPSLVPQTSRGRGPNDPAPSIQQPRNDGPDGLRAVGSFSFHDLELPQP